MIEALKYRVYANINNQEVIEVSDNMCVFKMNDCHIQSTRKRRGLPSIPCKEVEI